MTLREIRERVNSYSGIVFEEVSDRRELLRRLDVAIDALQQFTSAVTGTNPAVAEYALKEIAK